MRRRLAVRLGIALCLGAVAILVFAGAWNLHLQRSHLTGLVGISADRLADTIRRSTRDAMLRNDPDGVGRVIQNIAAQPGIARIRIFNKEGRIGTSTDPGEVGRLVDIRAEQCIACHQGGRPIGRLERKDRVRTFRDEQGRPLLAIIAPIHNEPQCASCHAHPAAKSVLGVLDVQLSMASVDEAMLASERQMGWGLALTVAAVVLVGGLLTWGLVLKPVRQLTEAMARVTQGDLETRVPVSSSDEIGAMASSWNAMTDELRRSREELERWNRTLEQRVEDKTAELRRTHERMLLVEKMASLGQLAAVVAHEINNPLAGIRTYARLLRRQLGASAEAQAAEADRVLAMVDGEAGRCGEIVRNLLLFSRSSPARFAEEDLRGILERCRLLLRHKAEMQGVTLSIEAAPDLPRVECDASQVEQMLVALTMNAIEATPADGRVSVSLAPEGEEVVLRVADTGGGIRPEDRPRIFEPFFTTKEPGKGVGLGLAVVYGIATRHHGRVDFDSAAGSGTVFSVRLPCRQPPRAEGESERAP